MLVDDASAEAAANARAIAALPELIEAARNALAKLDESPIEWGTADKLRRILARIDGEDT